MEINNLVSNMDFISKDNKAITLENFIKDYKTLNAGDMFSAIVKDIGVNNVVLKFDNGQELIAKSMILPNSRIGDNAIFIVKENVKGQILLEMLNNNSDNLKFGIISEALQNADMVATDENWSLVNTLIENNLSIDAETLQKAAFFKYFGKGLGDKEIVFLLKENIVPTENNINIFNGIMKKDVNIGQDILSFIDSISIDNIDELPMEIKNKINNLVKPNEDNIKQLIKESLFVNIKGMDSLKELNTFFKDLEKNIVTLKEFTNHTDNKSDSQANKILDNIQFSNNVNVTKQYIQIPFMINGNNQFNDCELIVYKKNKKNKDSAGNVSVLLKVNYLNVGNLEVFINKVNNIIKIDFGAENENIVKLFKSKSNQLLEMVKKTGVIIGGINFNVIKEEKNILTDFSKLDKTENTEINNKRRYTLDMRI